METLEAGSGLAQQGRTQSHAKGLQVRRGRCAKGSKLHAARFEAALAAATQVSVTLEIAQKRFDALANEEERHANHNPAQLAKVATQSNPNADGKTTATVAASGAAALEA